MGWDVMHLNKGREVRNSMIPRAELRKLDGA